MSELTREQVKSAIDELSLWLTYPALDMLHAIDETDAALRARVEGLDNDVRILWLRIEELRHDKEDLTAQLATMTAEREEYKRKYDLVCDSAEYRECCDRRVQAETNLATARARITALEEALREQTELKDFYIKMWGVRGKALLKPCPRCGTFPPIIKAQESQP